MGSEEINRFKILSQKRVSLQFGGKDFGKTNFHTVVRIQPPRAYQNRTVAGAEHGFIQHTRAGAKQGCIVSPEPILNRYKALSHVAHLFELGEGGNLGNQFFQE